MRRTHTRFIGAMAAIVAAGLAGYSLRPSPGATATVAARNPAAEVKTQVIRRTIHIVRHERRRHAPTPHAGPFAVPAGGSRAARRVRTGASASHGAGSPGRAGASGTAAVATRTSPSHASPGAAPSSPATAGTAPVTTRTSPSHASPGTASGSPATAPKPVTTRTSASHGTPSGTAKGGSGSVTTRTSGAGGADREGGDHGD
jgi:hypothetical protein